MTSERQRKRVARELPPVGTTLTATHKGQAHTAEIVDAKELPAGKAVKYGDGVSSSLSAAAYSQAEGLVRASYSRRKLSITSSRVASSCSKVAGMLKPMMKKA
jgi:hypothetical protein